MVWKFCLDPDALTMHYGHVHVLIAVNTFWILNVFYIDRARTWNQRRTIDHEWHPSIYYIDGAGIKNQE
jgi:hypothetical protein